MNVVITGASKGIGKECAQKFCQNNTENLILIARNEKLLKKTASECARINRNVHIHIVPLDLKRLLSGKKIPELEEIGQITNTIDILVNNAGLLINKSFITM
jgi:short-subunit dehydrogenase